jgi:pimeloyl-ACP methyl ester carboxylesterase
VDGAAITLIGHSQGASFVPGMLIDDPDLAAGVMLAAPHDPLEKVLTAQDEAYADVARLRSEDVAGDTMIEGASADFWRSWLRVTDGVPQLVRQVTQPLLVVGGELDANVPAAQLDAWQQTLRDDEQAQVVELECVTHALNCVSADDLSTAVPADVGETVAPSVTTALVEFLDTAVH